MDHPLAREHQGEETYFWVGHRTQRPIARLDQPGVLDNELVQGALMIAAAVIPIALSIILPTVMQRPGSRGEMAAARQAPAAARSNSDKSTPVASGKPSAPDAAEPPEKQPTVIAIFHRAKKRLANGDYVAAIRDFDNLLRAKPEFAWCYYYRAGANSRMGNQAQALDDLNAALSVMPTEPKIWRGRAVVYRRMGDLPSAVADIERAVELTQHGRADVALAKVVSAKADQLLGELHQHATAAFSSGDHQTAIVEFSAVVRHRPDFASAWLRRAICYDAAGQYDKALDDLNVALHLRPGPAQAFKMRSVLYERKGDYAAALVDMRGAHRLDPARTDYGKRIRWLAGRQQLQSRSRQVATRWRLR